MKYIDRKDLKYLRTVNYKDLYNNWVVEEHFRRISDSAYLIRRTWKDNDGELDCEWLEDQEEEV